MDILNIAIKAEGTAVALAKKLGTTPSRIGNWKTRGVPDGWANVLAIKYAKAIKQAEKQEAVKV